jgi:leader peptidase (prepilin peptidase)/N-methyltransferase
VTSWGDIGSAGPLLAVLIGVLGLILSPLAELLIARLLPRVGGLPPVHVRLTTAMVTGLVCAAFALSFGADARLPAFLLLAVLGVQLARIDISLHLLPNPLILSLLLGGLCFILVSVAVDSQWASLARAAASAAILFFIYLVLALTSPGAIGMGDVKLAGPIGLYLGYLGWTQLLYGGLFGFLVNGIATVVLVASNRGKRPSEVAHGPSMLAGAAVVALFLPWN